MVAVGDTDRMAMRLDAECGDDQVRVEVELDSDDPLAQLRGLRAAIVQIEAWQLEAVVRASRGGASWSEIGEALGVTKQAAWAMYHDYVRQAH